MLKRIHSEREPGVTLWSEIRKEFAIYFTRFGHLATVMLEKRPRLGIWIMLVTLLISTGLSFTIFRGPKTGKKATPIKFAPSIHDGIDGVLSAAAAVRESVKLKHFVDSIATRKALTSTDSIALDSALSKLEQLRNIIYHP